MRRLIVGMTGATGAILGVRLLEALKECDVESHLVISNWARRTIEHETPYTIQQVSALATVYHNADEHGGRDLVGLVYYRRHGSDPVLDAHARQHRARHWRNLVHRAADVVLKERRRLVLVARESPLSEVHLENMLKLARMGVINRPADAGLLQPSQIHR